MFQWFHSTVRSIKIKKIKKNLLTTVFFSSDAQQVKPELLLDRPVGSTHVGDDEVRQRDLRKMFQRHEETLHNHTEQLEETCTKIETIREMLDDRKGMSS